MAQVIYRYEGYDNFIQCQLDEKLKSIFQKISNKIQVDVKKLMFLYDGKHQTNDELTFNQVAKALDKEDKKIIMTVYKIDDDTDKRKVFVKANEIICPECNESVDVKLNDYKINLYNCKNNHNNNVLIKDYEKSQLMEISKIMCEICNDKNKSEVHNYKFFKCLTCKKNMCPGPICYNKHDKSHKIIDYDERNYMCENHAEKFNSYCNNCNKDICLKCERDHGDHQVKVISYGRMLPDENKNNELKSYTDKLRYVINEITNKLNNIVNTIELYYNISNNMINNINNGRRNYQIFKNVNKFLDYNNDIIKDIKEIVLDDNIYIQFKNLMNFYNKLNDNKNYIIAEIEIKKDDINKDIKIINSFEQYKRESNREDKENDYKYQNEYEIKNYTKIKINDEIIPFSYYYKFKNEGKYKIKYLFDNYLTKTSFMFLDCKNISNIDLSNLNTLALNNMNAMFYGCESLKNINLSNFNAQNVIDMGCLFCECKSLSNLDLSSFKTDKLDNMNGMFYGCESLTNINLSNFKTQNVTDMSNIFCGCKSLANLDLSNFTTQNVKSMKSMFNGCKSLSNIDLSRFNTQNLQNISFMFRECETLKEINLSNFNIQNVTNMSGMFYECGGLTKINLSGLNTKNVKDMSYIFFGCKSLNNINLSNLDTQNLTDIGYMFYECKSLNKIDLSSFNTQNVTNLSCMLFECESLTNLNLSNFNTQKVEDMNAMFYGCKSLKKENINTRDNKILNYF